MSPIAVPWSLLLATPRGSMPVFSATNLIWSNYRMVTSLSLLSYSLPSLVMFEPAPVLLSILHDQGKNLGYLCSLVMVGKPTWTIYLPVVGLWYQPFLLVTIPIMSIVGLHDRGHVCGAVSMCELLPGGVGVCVFTPAWLPS